MIEQPVEQLAQTLSWLLHEPDPLLVEKILVAQRPDRAQIDHIARQFVGQRKFGLARVVAKDVDLFVAPRLMTISSLVPLISRVNRTQRLHITQRSTNSVTVSPRLAPPAGERLDVGPPLVLAVFEVKILQLAFAGFVADRAIDRMAEQQVFLDHGPRLCSPSRCW